MKYVCSVGCEQQDKWTKCDRCHATSVSVSGKLHPGSSAALTDKYNNTDLIYMSHLFGATTSIDCLHQPSSSSHQFTKKKRTKKRETSPKTSTPHAHPQN